MHCADLRDLLHPFLDGELEVAENVAILKHVELCAACRSRVESEKELNGVVARAARETVSSADRARILEGAFALADADAPGRHAALPRPRRWLLRAAGLLLAVGATWLVVADPLCFGGCPTAQIMAHSYASAHEAQPLSVTELKLRHPNLQLSALERLKSCQIDIVGGNVVSAPGTPDRAVFRLRCKKSGKVATFVWIPGGHSHFWQRRTRPDGRVYVRGASGMVGWEDERGVWGCLGEAGDETLYALASAVRDSGS